MSICQKRSWQHWKRGGVGKRRRAKRKLMVEFSFSIMIGSITRSTSLMRKIWKIVSDTYRLWNTCQIVRATPQILEFMEESKSPKMALLLLLTKPTKRSNKIYSLALVGLLRSPQNKRGFNDDNVIRNSTFLFCPFGKKKTKKTRSTPSNFFINNFSKESNVLKRPSSNWFSVRRRFHDVKCVYAEMEMYLVVFKVELPSTKYQWKMSVPKKKKKLNQFMTPEHFHMKRVSRDDTAAFGYERGPSKNWSFFNRKSTQFHSHVL